MFKISVGGTMFVALKNTFFKCAPNYFTSYFECKPVSNFIFIDRDPKYFELILNHIRGYSITLPKDEGELIRLYEDANFYGILSLVRVCEEELGLRLPDDKRELKKMKIRDLTRKYNLTGMETILPCINQLGDKELCDLEKKIEKQISIIQRSKNVNMLFNGLLNLAYYLEKEKNMPKLTEKLISKRDEAIKVIATNSITALLLFLFSL